MKKEIRLQKFDNTFEDYLDKERSCFVVYAGCKGADFNIDARTTIIDYDNVPWDCYLLSVEYIPSHDMYEILYKIY